jgi:hypothetical protein
VGIDAICGFCGVAATGISGGSAASASFAQAEGDVTEQRSRKMNSLFCCLTKTHFTGYLSIRAGCRTFRPCSTPPTMTNGFQPSKPSDVSPFSFSSLNEIFPVM